MVTLKRGRPKSTVALRDHGRAEGASAVNAESTSHLVSATDVAVDTDPARLEGGVAATMDTEVDSARLGEDARYPPHGHVLAALRRLRPSLEMGFHEAYAIFELLVAEVLLRGSVDPSSDADTICTELSQPEYGNCFRRWILLGEFERIVTTVVYLRGEALTKGVDVVWPAWTRQFDVPVREMIKAVMLELVARGREGAPDERALIHAVVRGAARGVPVDLSRVRAGAVRKGRPRLAGIDGLCLLVLREGLFKGGRSQAGALAQALKLAPPWESRSLRRRFERVRIGEVAIPRGWRDTLIAKRIVPLYGNPLQPTKERLEAVASIWGRGRGSANPEKPVP